MTVPKPQDTGCTTIEIELDDDYLSEGVTNGILSYINGLRKVQYEEERDVYVVGEARNP